MRQLLVMLLVSGLLSACSGVPLLSGESQSAGLLEPLKLGNFALIPVPNGLRDLPLLYRVVGEHAGLVQCSEDRCGFEYGHGWDSYGVDGLTVTDQFTVRISI